MLEIRSVGPACADVCVTVRRDDLLQLASLAIAAADEIEVTVNAEYPSRNEQDVQYRRHRRDMQIVKDLRGAIETIVTNGE
jgi:hypothetical protein